ncbi:MAG TPA: hypothetical protein DIC42_00225 [Holosporales bacterium]|nr:hypothetical protein [Holosporales bacterium]
MWARGYFVVTVGNLNQEDVQKYIENQEEHHKKDDFRISEFERLRFESALQAFSKTLCRTTISF